MFEQLNIVDIEKKLQYTFQNKDILQVAFTHSSYAYLHNRESNERLEFLGDSILGFVISCKLYALGQDEGAMTERRKNIVSAKPLEEAVLKLDIVKYLQVVDSVHVGEKRISSLYEAIVAAIYLDGGLAEVQKFIDRTLSLTAEVEENYKGQLQEFLQSKGQMPAKYCILQKYGADHAPHFVVKATVQEFLGKEYSGKGGAKRLKNAEQLAAKALLQQLQVIKE